MQDFKVKPSTNHSANVLGQLPPVIICMYIVLTEEVVHINSLLSIIIIYFEFLFNLISTIIYNSILKMLEKYETLSLLINTYRD